MFKKIVVGLLVVGVSGLACKKEEAAQESSGAQLAGREAGSLRVKRGVLVANSLGGMGALRNTNSIEALKCNYERGFRWFEVDLALTADNELVCFHKGDEKLAELPDKVSKLPLSAVEGKKYGGLFGIARLSTVLGEAERLDDVVLVANTNGWSERMKTAVSSTLGGADKASRRTRIILQAYKGADLPSVVRLSNELGAGVMLNLDHAEEGDEEVEALAKKHSLLAVVTDSKRFTPWLVQRLHAIDVPVLVHTLNEHRDIVSFMRAGADGFYTDRYVPYDAMAADPVAAIGCGTAPAATERSPWAERDAMQPRQFRLRQCAKRRTGRIDLAGCDDRPAIYGAYLAAPAGQKVHVDLEAEAGDTAAAFWLELVHQGKDTTVQPREQLQLAAKERRRWQYDISVPQVGGTVEARLGLLSNKDKIRLYRFKVSQPDAAPTGEAPSPPQDAGE